MFSTKLDTAGQARVNAAVPDADLRLQAAQILSRIADMAESTNKTSELYKHSGEFRVLAACKALEAGDAVMFNQEMEKATSWIGSEMERLDESRSSAWHIVATASLSIPRAYSLGGSSIKAKDALDRAVKFCITSRELYYTLARVVQSAGECYAGTELHEQAQAAMEKIAEPLRQDDLELQLGLDAFKNYSPRETRLKQINAEIASGTQSAEYFRRPTAELRSELATIQDELSSDSKLFDVVNAVLSISYQTLIGAEHEPPTSVISLGVSGINETVNSVS